MDFVPGQPPHNALSISLVLESKAFYLHSYHIAASARWLWGFLFVASFLTVYPGDRADIAPSQLKALTLLDSSVSLEDANWAAFCQDPGEGVRGHLSHEQPLPTP